jgi:hypothetical protein
LGHDWANALAKIVGQAQNGFDLGNAFGTLGGQLLCNTLGKIDGLEDQIHTGVRVSAAPSRFGPVGTPLTRGKDCTGEKNLPRPNPMGQSVGIRYGVPDFIIGDKPIADDGRSYNEAFLVGDFKWSAKALHDDYAAKHPRQPEQYAAVIGYAHEHTYLHTALFIAGHNSKILPGGRISDKQMRQVKAMLARTLTKQHVLPAVINLVD